LNVCFDIFIYLYFIYKIIDTIHKEK